MFLKKCLFALISLMFSSYLSFSQPIAKPKKSLSNQSKEILWAMKRMPGQGDTHFLANFPKNLSEFNKICASPKFDELYSCHDLFYPHLERLMKERPDEAGKILANLAATVKYDADAPNYLQDLWRKFCIGQIHEFVNSIEGLKSKKLQEQSLKYLNEYLHHPNNIKIKSCIKSLEVKKYSKWANKAKKYLYKEVRKH